MTNNIKEAFDDIAPEIALNWTSRNFGFLTFRRQIIP